MHLLSVAALFPQLVPKRMISADAKFIMANKSVEVFLADTPIHSRFPMPPVLFHTLGRQTGDTI